MNSLEIPLRLILHKHNDYIPPFKCINMTLADSGKGEYTSFPIQSKQHDHEYRIFHDLHIGASKELKGPPTVEDFMEICGNVFEFLAKEIKEDTFDSATKRWFTERFELLCLK